LPKKFLTEDGFDLRCQVAEAPVGTDGHSFQDQLRKMAATVSYRSSAKPPGKSSASGAQTGLRLASKTGADALWGAPIGDPI